MFLLALVCLFVSLSFCLLAKQLKKLWTDLDEIFMKCQKSNEEQVIRFWKLSVERRPPPTFKVKITLQIFY